MEQGFSDEFGGSDLDRSKWITCYPWAPGRLQHRLRRGGVVPAANVSTGGGALNLTAKKETVTGWGKSWDYTSGMVNTGPDLNAACHPSLRSPMATSRHECGCRRARPLAGAVAVARRTAVATGTRCVRDHRNDTKPST